jgi:hypothetical protein
VIVESQRDRLASSEHPLVQEEDSETGLENPPDGVIEIEVVA